MEKKFVKLFFMAFITIGVVIAIRGVGTVIDASRSTDWPLILDERRHASN